MNNSYPIPRNLVNQILRHAQQGAESEVCGLIGARDGRAASVYPVANVASEPDHLFAMDAAGQIAAMRQIREQGEELFAIYHSHPHAPAEPSLHDVQQAAYPEALYLIVSLNTKGVLELRAFRLVGTQIEPVDLVVEES